mgnify:CR=1 FL=1
MSKNIVVIGSSGAIGNAFIDEMAFLYKDATIHAFSRTEPKRALANVLYHPIDYEDEASIAQAALVASQEDLIDILVVATGVLHYDEIMPERALKELSSQALHHVFAINTICLYFVLIIDIYCCMKEIKHINILYIYACMYAIIKTYAHIKSTHVVVFMVFSHHREDCNQWCLDILDCTWWSFDPLDNVCALLSSCDFVSDVECPECISGMRDCLDQEPGMTYIYKRLP